MAIDPLRTTGGRIISLHDRTGTRRAADATPRGTSDASATTEAEPTASDGLDVRKALVLARIQKDYYSQAHVRERVIDSLLQFLDEE